MRKFDKGWAQLNTKNGNGTTTYFSPQPIGYVNKQKYLVRLLKATKLYFSTYYSWQTSWHMAAA